MELLFPLLELVSHHLEVKICSELRRDQRERAEGIICLMDEFLNESVSERGGEGDRMQSWLRESLSLTDSQVREVERIVVAERVALRSKVADGNGDRREPRLPRLSVLFHERESRITARTWALKMTELLISTGRGMARLYAVLNKEQRKDFVRLQEEVETRMRGSIVLSRSFTGRGEVTSDRNSGPGRRPAAQCIRDETIRL